jgi:hypothetical protein
MGDHLPFTVETDDTLVAEACTMFGAVDAARLNLEEGYPGPLTIYKDGIAVETWDTSPKGLRVTIPPRRTA